MQELVYTALVPHPPIVIPEVGRAEADQVLATRSAMARVCTDALALAPEVVVIISPHGPVFQDAIAVHALDRITGNLGDFGAGDVSFDVPVDRELAQRVVRIARTQGLPVAPVTAEFAADWDAEHLDHGTMVPLYFLREAGWTGPILPVAIGLLPTVDLYAFGQVLQKAIHEHGRRAVVLASGDLSHRITPEGPYGFHPAGPAFDREVVEALGRGDLTHIFSMEHSFCESAASCGLRPLMMLAGVLDGLEMDPEVLAYEGPFGVGYAVVPVRPGSPSAERECLQALREARAERISARRASSHPVVVLARTALEHYVQTGLVLDFSAGAPHEGTAPWQLPKGLPERAGVFVSLKIDGELRGCMGSVEPTEPTLALEIVRNAIMAGTEDPRFGSVEEEELDQIDYSVDILSEPEPATPDMLDPKRYGLVVVKGEQSGLLLPDLAGVETVEEQLHITCRKAGLEPGEPGIQLFRFTVSRYL